MKSLKPCFFWRPMIPVSSRGIEPFVDGGRCDLLDHVIVFNERHLKRLMTKYVRYYHEDRTHLALEKRTPAGRVAGADTDVTCKVLAMPRLGGLHHRYDLAA
jgi:putative transposase